MPYAVGGQVIATRVTNDPVSGNNGLSYFFTDHLGSSSALQMPNGTVAYTWYLPFGGYRPGSAPTQTITDRDFTGQRENMELGLLYYNARYYVPGLGRFASADTIVPNPIDPQSLNRFSYVRNNPLNRSDPTGHVDCNLLDGGEDTVACLTSGLPTGPLVRFATENDDVANFTAAERATFEAGAAAVAEALAREINRWHPGWNISPEQAFMLVYDGPITFKKMKDDCMTATGFNCRAKTFGTEIRVYTDAYSGDDPLFLGNHWWVTHELGHAFESKVNTIRGYNYARDQLADDAQIERRPENGTGNYGFAGPITTPRVWQQTTAGGPLNVGEELADMYIGWTHNQWESVNGALTSQGLARSNFMARNMPQWIDLLIGH